MSLRTIVIGDIHGCLNEFKALLQKITYNAKHDRLILVGDLISKGPYPFETLQFARELNCEVVMGNHERAFLLWLQGRKHAYSGFKELKQKMLSSIDEWQKWFESLPLYIESSDFIVVHAGLNPQLPLDETDAHLLTTIRHWNGITHTSSTHNDPAWFESYSDNKLVIFGHWAKRGLIVKDNIIGLDSGCVYGKKLSAVILPERTIAQVSAQKIYQKVMRT